MPAFLGLGVLNGLLPCGMVYVALAAALGLGTVQQAAAFMFFYGLGTAPAMLGIGWVWQRVTPALRRRMGVAVPLYTLALGLLLLWRGLALGLPLSPAAPAAGHAGPAAVMCK